MARGDIRRRAAGRPAGWFPPGLALLASALIVAVGGSCGGDDDADREDASSEAERAAEAGDEERLRVAEGRPYTVQTLTETFVDESRPVEDPLDDRNAPERTLVTDVYVPDGEGPFPLVVHAHGFDGNPGKHTELLTHWAEAGYVVAAPAFPLTNDLTTAETGTRGIVDDYVNQPADVAFVIDETLRLSNGDHPVLGGRVDPERIGVSGLSLGGATLYGLVFHDCCRDGRIDAVILMSARPLHYDDGDYELGGVPTLLLHSTDDTFVRYREAEDAYGALDPPKFLVTLEGDEHFEPYEDVASPFDQVVRDVTLPFWDAYLVGDDAAVDRLVEAADASDHTRITTDR